MENKQYIGITGCFPGQRLGASRVQIADFLLRRRYFDQQPGRRQLLAGTGSLQKTSFSKSQSQNVNSESERSLVGFVESTNVD